MLRNPHLTIKFIGSCFWSLFTLLITSTMTRVGWNKSNFVQFYLKKENMIFLTVIIIAFSLQRTPTIVKNTMSIEQEQSLNFIEFESAKKW